MAKSVKRNEKPQPEAAVNGDVEQWLTAYQKMVQIRVFEDHVNQLYRSAKMPGLAHLYSGQEAVAVGVCEALDSRDHITSTHRGHGHCLARGAKVPEMFAELLGKEAGYCRGKGGSMHIADQDTGNLGANAIVGGSAGIATGAALSAKMRGAEEVSVCFFGEGALGQGLLYEVMNMASLWSLPVLYVCENNLYNEYTHFSETTAGDLMARPRAFGITTEEVDGQDVRAVFATASKLVDQIRSGHGPAFLLCHTYRYHGHHVGDIDRTYYRSKEEEQQWRSGRDPIELLGNWLVDNKLTDQVILEGIQAEVEQVTDQAERFALEADYPEANEVSMHVYA